MGAVNFDIPIFIKGLQPHLKQTPLQPHAKNRLASQASSLPFIAKALGSTNTRLCYRLKLKTNSLTDSVMDLSTAIFN